MIGARGKIKWSHRASQQIDYSGVRFKNATPSDADGVLELGDTLYIFYEFKHEHAQDFTGGQKLLLQRITDRLQNSGATAITIVAEHNTPIHQEIDGANSKVTEIRWNGEWVDLRAKCCTVKQCSDRAYYYAFGSYPSQTIIQHDFNNKIL